MTEGDAKYIAALQAEITRLRSALTAIEEMASQPDQNFAVCRDIVRRIRTALRQEAHV